MIRNRTAKLAETVGVDAREVDGLRSNLLGNLADRETTVVPVRGGNSRRNGRESGQDDGGLAENDHDGNERRWILGEMNERYSRIAGLELDE